MMQRWGMTPPQWRELPEDDRELLLADSQLVCPSCGNLRSLCSNPESVWYPQRDQCYATAARDVVTRRLREKHDKPPGRDMHPLDGLSVWVSEADLTPEDDFTD